MRKIRKGDTVRFISGKEKGKEGKVLGFKENRILVEGINMATKHQKPSAGTPQGGIVTKEAYLDASNVMLLFKGQLTRVGFRMDGDKKVRVAKKTGEVID